MHLVYVGSDLVDWLHTNVEGFIDRRHARKYAALMLKVSRTQAYYGHDSKGREEDG